MARPSRSSRAAAPLGYVIYRGPSMLDGAPIVVIASGFQGAKNKKTGSELIQVYILRDDMSPREAVETGADASICGDCAHRYLYDTDGAAIPATRSCYVNIAHGPRITFEAYKRGTYVDVTDQPPSAIAALFLTRKVRFGAYGDPAAVPFNLLHLIAAAADGVTAYTHQWRRFPDLAAFCMASADTVTDRVQAAALGFRVFRVAPETGWTRDRSEVLCPASEEAGKKVTCSQCMACGGNGSKARANIMIPLHGMGYAAAMRRGTVTEM